MWPSKYLMHINKQDNNNKSLNELVEDVFRFLYPQKWHITFAEVLTNNIFHKDLFQGASKKYIIEYCRYDLRKTCPLISGTAIAEAMDLSDYKVNHEALHVLRKISTDNCNNGWIASHRSVTTVMKQINNTANKSIPYYILDKIDGVQFDYTKLLIFCLKMFSLYDVAKNEGNVLLAITLDQADISTNVCHITAGVKFIDHRGKDPISGLPIGATDALSPQSCDVCIPFKMVLLKDSQEVYENYFRDFFDFFKTLSDNPPDNMLPFNIVSPQDMSSHWKTLLKGGAAKRDNYFCHCCNCTSDLITVPRKNHV
jgi:hypothetical protein